MSKFWLSLHLFLSPFTTLQYTNFVQQTQILLKLGAFYNNLPKIHPIYVNGAPSSAMKPPDCYTKICEKAPQKAGTKYIYHVYVRTPPKRYSITVYW